MLSWDPRLCRTGRRRASQHLRFFRICRLLACSLRRRDERLSGIEVRSTIRVRIGRQLSAAM